MLATAGTMQKEGFDLKQPPVRMLTDFITPLRHAFVVYHMGVPRIDRAAWRLVIGGMVEHELSLSRDDLAAMPQVEFAAVHECAGSPLRPKEPVRRVANVIWRGVRLAALLDRAGVEDGAQYLWSYGCDHGTFAGVANPCYLKDLPLAEARRDDVLLATHINGEPLPDERGGPMRLVVPGFYGTNSTKWVVRLEARDIRSPGYFTTALYNDRIETDRGEVVRPVWRLAPHAIIVVPAEGSVLTRAPLTIRGWAWGEQEIASVEVSTDGGATWAPARLASRKGREWQAFELDWVPARPGEQRLCCRATDRAGNTQPESGARNEIFRLTVTVQ
jgi:DMSO/TMAO reductase YedYZ molybdopterin-dependent catalytic subunit